jgi:excinuclease UvrABC nuclease subunit
MAWKKISWNDRKKFPEISCVYAFYINDELVYIGSTVNLKLRMVGYKFIDDGDRLRGPWRKSIPLNSKIEVKYKGSKIYGYWLMLEARLIKRIQPKFNIKLKNGTHNG